EEVYQKTTDTTLAQETGIFLKGVGEGLNWYAQGQLGQAAKNFFQVAKDPMINFINNMNFSTLKNTGAKIIQGAKSILSSIKNNGLDFIKSSIKNSSFASLQASDNLLDSIGIIGDNVSDWLIGDEEFNKTNALKATGELLGAWALNMFFDGASTTLTNKLQKAKLGTSFGARTLDLDITVRTIPISTLDEIIQNEELFNKFLDFDNNKDAFGEITQLELANAMKEYFETAKKNNIDLGFNNAELNRMISIIDNFSIDVEKFYLDKLLSSYNSKYNDFMLYASNPEVILEPDFLLAMRSDWDEYLKNAAPDDPYAIAINQMREEFNINGFRCLARGIDVGETNFKIITDDLLTKDYVSPNTFIEIELYIEKYGYSLGYKGDYVYLQYKRRKAAEGFKDSLAQEIEKFTGSLVSQGKIESIQNSFRFQFKHVFEAESPHKNAMGYNDGTTSTICLGYDIPILKSIMNHESIHQVSHSDIKNDPQTGARISIAGINYSKFNTLTKKWSNQRKGMNEAITEYFNQLIMGVEYPPGNCGYEDAVEKLKSFIDMGIFSVDELKVAYFTNNPDIITGKLDAIGTQLGIKNYSDKIYKSFDKAIDDKGNIRTKGIQELNKILKESQLAING
ncbi:MAG: hypothetical protein IJZ77_04320, partial [Bacilli bacterium]|nr:hypothetical protein [Bacilli bacterium]